MKFIKKGIKGGVVTVACCLIMGGQVSAHVTVKPVSIAPASYATFTVSVPNERTDSTVEVRLVIPDGLQSITPTIKTGWEVVVQTDDADVTYGHTGAKVTEIIWKGGEIPQGLRDDFTFSAKVPAEEGQLIWKAYQTYADGVTVAWDKSEADQPKKADGTADFSAAGPFSVTKISEQNDTTPTKLTESSTDRWALYIAVTAVIVSLMSLFLATRTPRQR